MTKKNMLLAALLSVTALGGAAVAAETIAGSKGPMRADGNGDGIVSRSEYFAAAETRFKARDTNGDRKLSGDEMKDRRGRFARQDGNNDGALSFDEATARASAQFQRLDANKDGKLTPEEMGPRGSWGHRGHGGPGGGPGGPGMMRGPGGGMGALALQHLDSNKDGKIGRDEMRAQAEKRFDRLDANKDGFVDRAELRTMRGRGPVGGPVGDMPPPPPEDDGI